MTEQTTHPPTDTVIVERRATNSRISSGAKALLGPLWVTTFREPVRTGRLRLDGLTGPERLMARAGLVALLLLLASVLYVEQWRQGALLQLGSTVDTHFLPSALLAPMLVALYLSLVLVVWGALDAAPSVRLLVALFYVLVVASLATPSGLDFGGSWILRHIRTVTWVTFWVPPGALVLSAVLARFVPVERWLTPVLRGLCLLNFAALLVAQLWAHAEFTDAGSEGILPVVVHSGLTSLDVLLLPLVVVAAVAVIDFATDVSTSLAEPASRARPRWAWALALTFFALVVVKLWVQVVERRDYWEAFARRQPGTLVSTLVMLGLLAGVVAVTTRLAAPGADADVDSAKERVTLGGAFVIYAVPTYTIAASGLVYLVTAATEDYGSTLLETLVPAERVGLVVPAVGSLLAVVVGARLLWKQRQRSTPYQAGELGSALVVVGVWNLPLWLGSALFDAELHFSRDALGVMATVGLLGWALVNWRRLDVGRCTLAIAVLLFIWLTMSRGDYIGFAGGLLGLPGILVVVFGIVYTIFSGAGFTTESSKRLPRESRTLMFVGYLLLSVTLLHWFEAIHDPLSDLQAQAGFTYVAIPVAAWLLARRIVPRASTPVTEEAEPEGLSRP